GLLRLVGLVARRDWSLRPHLIQRGAAAQRDRRAYCARRHADAHHPHDALGSRAYGRCRRRARPGAFARSDAARLDVPLRCRAKRSGDIDTLSAHAGCRCARRRANARVARRTFGSDGGFARRVAEFFENGSGQLRSLWPHTGATTEAKDTKEEAYEEES